MEQLVQVCKEYLVGLTPEAAKILVEAYRSFIKDQQSAAILLTEPVDSKQMVELVDSTKDQPIAPFVVITRAIRRINSMLFFNDMVLTDQGKLVVSLDTHIDIPQNHEDLDNIYTALKPELNSPNLLLFRWPVIQRKVEAMQLILTAPTVLTKTKGKYNLHFLDNEVKGESNALLKVILGKYGYKKLIGNQHFLTNVEDFNAVVRSPDYFTLPKGLLQPKFVDVIEHLKSDLEKILTESKAAGNEYAVYTTLYKEL